MSGNQSHEAKRFQLLSSVGQIGWWEADKALCGFVPVWAKSG